MIDNIEKLAALQEQLHYFQIEQDNYYEKYKKRDANINKKMRDLQNQIKKLKRKTVKRTKGKNYKGKNPVSRDKEFHILKAKNRLSILQNLININLNSEKFMDRQDIKSSEEVVNVCIKEAKESLLKIISYKKKEKEYDE